MDILPRVFDKFWLPPKCPLDSVTFVKQREMILFGKEEPSKLGKGYD